MDLGVVGRCQFLPRLWGPACSLAASIRLHQYISACPDSMRIYRYLCARVCVHACVQELYSTETAPITQPAIYLRRRCHTLWLWRCEG